MSTTTEPLLSLPATLVGFCHAHTGFDIESADLLSTESVATLGLNDPSQSEVLKELRRWQRLTRISPDTATALQLHALHIDSAQQVLSMSRTVFIRTFGPRLEGGAAGIIYDKSLQVKDQTMHLLANVHSVVASPYYRHMASRHIGAAVTDYFENLSDYQKIFGSLNFCSCCECRSIFGAAAYFVDLMRIIDKAVTVPNKTNPNPIPQGLSLQDRRPDLWQIELTCDNTNTMIPYLQIVNGILQNTVLDALNKETPGSNPIVWQAMSRAVYPFNTPYNMPLNQVRTLLGQFNLDLGAIIAAFDPQLASPLGLAVETLHLTQESYLLVTTPDTTAAALTAAYGTTVGDNDNGGLEVLTKMLRQTALNRGTFQSLLRQGLSDEERYGVTYTYVPSQFGTRLMLVFFGDQVVGAYDYFYGTLQGTLKDNLITGTWSEASMDPPDNEGRFEFTLTSDRQSFTGKWMKGYDTNWESTPWNGQQSGQAQSVTLAHQLFINQGLAGQQFMDIAVNDIDPLSPFEEITHLDHDALDRINRFIRLAASIGWDYQTLDWVMCSLGLTVIDEATILGLAEVAALATRLAISPITLAACWFDLKTTGMGDEGPSQSPFDTIFNDPALIRNGPDLDYYHPVTIVAPLPGANAMFYNPTYLNPPLDWVVDQTLFVQQLAGAPSASPAAGAPGVPDASSLTYARRILSGIKATNNDLTAIAKFFFPGVATISLGVSNLSLLYRHVLLASRLGFSVTDYLLLLKLLGHEEDTLVTADGVRELADLADWIRASGFTVYELDYILHANASLYINTGYSEDSLAAFLASFKVAAATLLIKPSGFITNAIPGDVSIAFYNYFLLPANGFLDSQGVVLQLLSDQRKEQIKQLTLPNGSTITPTQQQLDDAQARLNQRYADQQRFLAGNVAEFFTADSGLVTVLLSGVAGIQSVASVFSLFLQQTATDTGMKDFIQMFSQHLMMARRIQLTSDELNNVYQYTKSYLSGGNDTFNFKPLLLSNVWNVWKMKSLVRSFQDTRNRFIGYLALAAQDKVTAAELDKLCTLTGWHPDQCRFVCGILFGTNMVCKTVGQIYEVNHCFQLGGQLGLDMYFLKSLADLQLLPAGNAANWRAFTDRSNALTGALRAHFGDEAWSAVFKKYNGPLLEQQRNVLEAFSLWQLGLQYKDITTTRNLYEFLLIDVDMGGCSEISYIRQALNSAQLYLQRCRLNLEINVSISTDDIPDTWWPWLTSYRVWEANRQVFLYPENYLNPTLRKTKTNEFRQLENDLTQGEVNKASAGKAFRKYLDSFSQLAKLQYVDACQYTVHDPSLGAAETLFLFARTPSDPAIFYYITRRSGSIWSQWEKIDITIPSDYITPVYVFNRLFLFWVELSSVQENDPTNTQNANGKCTVLRASIKYSFIDFSGNWTQPQSLLDNRVIDVEAYTDLHGPFDPSMFQADRLYWHKVGATPVSGDNFTDPVDGRISGDKLVIYYGPLLKVVAGTAPLTVPKPVATGNKAQLSFEETIGDAVTNYNTELAAQKNGKLPLNRPVVMDEGLNASWLIDQDEFVYLADDVFGLDTTPTFLAGFDIASGALILHPSANTIADNYTEGMDSHSLVGAGPATATDGSYVWPGGGITPQLSATFAAALVTAKIVSEFGQVMPAILSATVPSIQSIISSTPVQARYVYDVLYQLYCGSPVLLSSPEGAGAAVLPVRNLPCSFLFLHPAGAFLFEPTGAIPPITNALQVATAFGWVSSTAFVNAGMSINTSGSQSIYTGLQSTTIKLVNADGFVDLAKAANVTPDMISGLLQITDAQALYVLNVLLSSGKTAMQYVSTAVDPNLNDNNMSFTTTRLTTGAIQDLTKRLFAGGVDGLLQLSAQQAPINVGHCFGDFGPGAQVGAPEAFYDNQVAFSGPYGYYYWELFYYAPALVAFLLNNNQQFLESESWQQYIFNPTLPPFSLNPDSFVNRDITKARSEQFFTLLVTAGYLADGQVTFTGNQATVAQIAAALGLDLQIDPNGTNLRIAREMQNMLQNAWLINPLGRYWQFKPFRNHSIATLRDDLTNPTQIKTYNDDPFDPDAIARLRIGAYEKNAVMQYIDNLLDWGDQEFTQYTWESITTATMLYVYAYDLLGPRPENTGECATQPSATFADIAEHYKGGNIPQFLIDLENTAGCRLDVNTGRPGGGYNDLDVYFCVPDNAMFVGYWDRVEDRLYKIRHCLNINGQPQPLPLFDPLLNPMQLVKAAAAGNGVLNTQTLLQPAIPLYRFTATLARAYSLANSVVQLGGALLAALEKNDSEGLSLLTNSQQIVLQNMMTVMKQQQIDLQEDTIAALSQSLQSAQFRLGYYTNLLQEGLNGNESTSLLLSAEALTPQALAQGIRGISIAGYLAPNIFGFADGGMQFGDAINMGAGIGEGVAAMLNQSAGVHATMAQYTRRSEEWTLQRQTAQYDVQQIAQQLMAAGAQLAYNRQDLATVQKNIEQTERVDSFLRTKFTSQEMYQWMIGRLSTLYYSTYQLAVNTALAAQAAYQFELGRQDTFISYNYWDTLRKGLLAGEGLMLSLQQMESSYLNNNIRCLEIEKTISLRQAFPQEFLRFIWGKDDGQRGVLNFTLSESMFDFDFPGHYCRRIKTVSISVPAVIGPYQNINASLTQVSNQVLLKADPNDVSAVNYLIYTTSAEHDGPVPSAPPQDVLRSNWMPNQQIAISSGLDDSGLFQLDFNDQRYLPFEGTGAVSGWTFSLPPETNRINFDNISDVIVKLRYTALDGGRDFAGKVKGLYAGTGPQYFNLMAKSMFMNQAYSAAWFKLFTTPPAGGEQAISFRVTDNWLLTTLRNIRIHSVLLQIEAANDATVNAGAGDEFITLKIGSGTPQAIEVKDNFGELTPTITGDGSDMTWTFSFILAKTPAVLRTDDPLNSVLDPKKFLDMAVVVVYQANPF